MTELKVEPGFQLQNPFSLHYTMLTPEVLRLCSFIHSQRSKKQISFSLESENCRCLKLNWIIKGKCGLMGTTEVRMQTALLLCALTSYLWTSQTQFHRPEAEQPAGCLWSATLLMIIRWGQACKCAMFSSF